MVHQGMQRGKALLYAGINGALDRVRTESGSDRIKTTLVRIKEVLDPIATAPGSEAGPSKSRAACRRTPNLGECSVYALVSIFHSYAA